MPFWHCFSSSDRFLFSMMCIIYKLAIAKIIHDCRVFWKLMLFVVVFFLFRMLSGFVEFDGYYLESDPCLVCNNPEVPFQVWLSLFIEILCSPSSVVFRDFTQHLQEKGCEGEYRIVTENVNVKPHEKCVHYIGTYLVITLSRTEGTFAYIL